MARVSQNGWPVIATGTNPRLKPFPWVTGRVLDGDVFTIFDYLCRRFNAEVETIRKDWSWGYANRPIVGGTSMSNHASGTAIDLNAPRHPIGKSGTFTAAQTTRIRSLMADLDHVVRWGGSYTGRKDEMHFEINASAAAVARVAARLRGTTTTPPKPAPTQPAPSKPKPSSGGYTSVKLKLKTLQEKDTGGAVRQLQGLLNAHRSAGLVIDGVFGARTRQHVVAFQRGHDLVTDGIVGKRTWTRLLAQ